ncbi:MAG: histone deacetylase, partial [Bacteroidota bacterium]
FLRKNPSKLLKISWSPLYHHPLPEGHRFPMEKYTLIPEQLLYEGTIREENLYDPGKISEETVLLTHEAGYWEKLSSQTLSRKEIRKTGFPLSPLLVERAIAIPQGTIHNALYAMQHGVAINGAGGTHHAFTGHGEGFCLLNDIAIAANYLLHHQQITKALVVDLDVHQGNGTAQIFRNDPRVFTFSMHCEANYPMHKEQSDLDIGLPAKTGDEAYLKTLYHTLPVLIDQVEPDIIFYLAGVDIVETDKLGRLSCSRDACRLRDHFVLELCHRHEIPVAISLGGGYSPQIRDIIEAHCNTFRVAQEIFF